MTYAHITDETVACPWSAFGRLRPVVTGSSRPIGGINSLLILGYSIHEARSRPTQQLSPIFFPAFLRSCVPAFLRCCRRNISRSFYHANNMFQQRGAKKVHFSARQWV